MPVYNGAKYLRQALDSLLAQDYTNFELIISDNASTDDTAAICKEFATRDARIRYYCNEQNMGAIWNFNRVLKLAIGDYFMWAACDDLWESSYISTLLPLLQDNTDAALAFTAFNNIDESGIETRTYPYIFELSADNLFERLRNYLRQEECQGKANLIHGLMLRRILLIVGGLSLWSGVSFAADMLVVFKLLTVGKIILTERILFHKRLVQQKRENPSFMQISINLISYCWAHQVYLRGYARIFRETSSLTRYEKDELENELRERKRSILRQDFTMLLNAAKNFMHNRFSRVRKRMV